ncbi:hypothetical protein HZS_2633 [Henneguya salminicola]|nr:hypothetical protein HZS_2633 [Henneguya salminicola]
MATKYKPFHTVKKGYLFVYCKKKDSWKWKKRYVVLYKSKFVSILSTSFSFIPTISMDLSGLDELAYKKYGIVRTIKHTDHTNCIIFLAFLDKTILALSPASVSEFM